MLEFPYVPHYWKHGSKFRKLDKGYDNPLHVIGYDTETCKGEIETQQFFSGISEDIQWVKRSSVLDKFLAYMSKFKGYNIMFCFNAQFDLCLLLRLFIERFEQDDFEIQYSGWNIKVFCSRNWFAEFSNGTTHIAFKDIHCYFVGKLASVAKAFGLDIGKLEMPDQLGYKHFTIKDKQFVTYAMMDARLCYEMGVKIIEMHKVFDIPLSTSSANFAEKVFRRKFIRYGQQIKFPDKFAVMRLAEYAYHGGKNGYYMGVPCHAANCFEYDFNSAYPFAMYNLPSFYAGNYEKVTKFNEKRVGVYKVQGRVKECPYGILYDPSFHYFRNITRDVQCYVTSYELQEALASGEFKMDRCSGYVWDPESDDSPLKNYVQYFWEQKNNSKKGTVQYLFNKLCLNSLYGKFVQRNPSKQSKAVLTEDFGLDVEPSQETAGGLYHPFIGALITGNTRARLHHEEHILNAMDVSTDSVKSKTYYEPYAKKSKVLGGMELQTFDCEKCDIKNDKSFNGYFVRNRLNVIMCRKENHPLKGALHGFWGKLDELKQMAQTGRNTYQVYRMPMVREAMMHSGKPMFQFHGEDKRLNVDWETMINV